MGRSRRVDVISKSPEDSFAFGRKMGQEALPNTIFCFFGDLGAGKTTLIKGIVEGFMGKTDAVVSSPTFQYLNVYSMGEKNVYHFDLYRLKNGHDFFALGFNEYLDAGGITCIEWSERMASLLPLGCVRIELQHVNQTTRRIAISC